MQNGNSEKKNKTAPKSRTPQKPAGRTAGRTTAGARAQKKTAARPGRTTPSSAQRQRMNARRRKMMIRRRILILVIIAAIAVAAVFIVRAIMNAARVMEQENAARQYKTEGAVTIMISDIVHLSFPQLSVTEGEGRLSVDQFRDILEDLYYRGYVLTDVYDLASVREEDGTFSLSDLSGFPEGKTPLIISERDASYIFSRSGAGYGRKLVLEGDDENVAVKCEYDQLFGEGSITGDYDLVPVVESFIAEHPDFSYNGARGVLALSGYNGILGYRTAPYLAEFDNNPYAETYGLFDTDIEKEGAVSVAEALKEKGWHFAMYGYGDISYAGDSTIVNPDIDQWMSEVAPLIGGTDLCIFPQSTDIGSWEPYSTDNAKYTHLKDKGFRYFFTKTGNDSLLQIMDDYVREGIFEINNADDYQAYTERE